MDISRYTQRKSVDQLMQAAGESSDRGKAHVLAALKHIARMSGIARGEALAELRSVERIFEDYAKSGADSKFEKDRLAPLRAIIRVVEADAQQGAPADATERRG